MSSRSQLRRSAPPKRAPSNRASRRFRPFSRASSRFAPAKSASLIFEPSRLAFHRSASIKRPPARLAPSNLASFARTALRLARLRSASLATHESSLAPWRFARGNRARVACAPSRIAASGRPPATRRRAIRPSRDSSPARRLRRDGPPPIEDRIPSRVASPASRRGASCSLGVHHARRSVRLSQFLSRLMTRSSPAMHAQPRASAGEEADGSGRHSIGRPG